MDARTFRAHECAFLQEDTPENWLISTRAHKGAVDTGTIELLKKCKNLEMHPTLDGYEFSFRVSYFDSPPRSSTSSELCFKNSRCGILSTSWMIDRNLTQLRSSFWLIRLPVT
jgi:hypothetical protein